MNKKTTFHEFSKRGRLRNNPFFHVNKVESFSSIVLASILSIVIYFFFNTNDSDLILVNNITRSIVLNSSFALIGVLGFLISGLAILTGTINNKVVEQLHVKDKYEDLISIFFSFYHLGLVVGGYIIIFVFMYFVLSINFSASYVVWLFVINGFLLSYGLFFIIFQSVHLLKSSIAIFEISFQYSEEYKDTNSSDCNEFIDLRLDALLLSMLKKGIVNEKEFMSYVDECIEVQYQDLNDERKEQLKKKCRAYYNS